MNTTQDKVIDKIRKLMALSTSSNEHEAAAAAAKAQELLLKHNLDVSVLSSKEEQPTATKVDFTLGDTAAWLAQLVNGVAESHFCCIVLSYRWKGHTTKRERVFYMFGRPENVEVARYMSEYLHGTIMRLARATRGSNAYQNAFRHGCVQTVVQRLRAGMKKFEAESSDTRALVVVLNEAAVALKDQTFPELSKGRRSRFGYDGYEAGREAGKNIGLHAGLGDRRNAVGQYLLG